MDFFSAYHQGFARVAACALPVTIGDPAANAQAILDQARACDEQAVAVAVAFAVAVAVAVAVVSELRGERRSPTDDGEERRFMALRRR